jgi:phospholipase C
MKKKTQLFCALSLLAAASAGAHEDGIEKNPIPHLDHVIVIMMENHAAAEILGGTDTNTPFLNSYAKTVGQAANYWAVGHPSLTNYLELVGGSNFGLTDDNWPVWANGGCVDNNPAGSGCGGAYTPIDGPGTDYAFPATVDACLSPWFNQLGPLPQCATPGAGSAIVSNNWGIVSYPSITYTPKTIAHQLAERGETWKSYQESLPSTGSRVDGVNYADGTYSSVSPVEAWQIGTSNVSVAKLYAVKHNPFAYFRDIEVGARPDLSLNQVVGFDGADGLFADLARGTVPTFSFIAPNQCHDMHGAGGYTAQCGDDAHALEMGDAEVKTLVTAIKASPIWKQGKTALVIVWDENDYGNYANQVVALVDTNYASAPLTSTRQYNHYSLTKTIEAALDLPCLNHACDKSTALMTDLFGAH